MTRSLSSATTLLILLFANCGSLGSSAQAEDAPQPEPAAQSSEVAQPSAKSQSSVKSLPSAKSLPPAVPQSPQHKGKKFKKEKDYSTENKEARERRVIPFVEEQNPELAKLLAHLKKHKPVHYDQAVRELARTVTALSSSKGQDTDLYKLELRAWQAKTRVQLLAAQSMMGDKEGLKAKLREAIQEELQVKADELAYRRERSMAWYDRQIENLQEDREKLVEARLKKLHSASAKDGQPKAKKPRKRSDASKTP